MADIFKAGSGRVFLIKFRAGPTHEPLYQSLGMAGSPDWGQGDVTKIQMPSDRQYNQWKDIDSFQASPDRATVTITMYETPDRSTVMELIRLRCAFDVQIHMGICEDPRDFNFGWQKIRVFEDAYATGYSGSDHGALGGDGQAEITEEMPISARALYDILRMSYTAVASTQVGESVVAVDVCDQITCGACDNEASDGCQKIFAVTNSPGSSPGLLPQVIATDDAYATVVERWITTAGIGDQISHGVCAGQYFIAVGNATASSLHYADAGDILDSAETWVEVTTGIVVGKGPVRLWNYSPLQTFVAAKGGYIYKIADPAEGFVVLDAGTAVASDFNDISGWDAEHFACVGQAGAFVYTLDGKSFTAGTPPVGPTNLHSIAYRTEKEIWVGGDDGKFYVTTDYGDHWTTKTVYASATRADRIVWVNETVGFLAVRTSAPAAKVLRSISGGYSWYVVPETPGQSLPTFDYVNDLAVCENEPNRLWIGGLADNASDGILIRGTD